MPDYSKAVIYAIVSPSLMKWYIGSTCEGLYERLYHHKLQSNKCKSKLLLEQPDVTYFVLENFPCETKEQLLKRESESIKALGDMCINKKMPGRGTHESHRICKRKEYILDPSKIQERQKRKVECTCGSMISYGNLPAHRHTLKHINGH